MTSLPVASAATGALPDVVDAVVKSDVGGPILTTSGTRQAYRHRDD